MADGRDRDAADGMHPVAGGGSGPRESFDRGAQREGREGPVRAAAGAAAPLESHLERVKALRDRDLAAGAGISPTHWRTDASILEWLAAL